MKILKVDKDKVQVELTRKEIEELIDVVGDVHGLGVEEAMKTEEQYRNLLKLMEK